MRFSGAANFWMASPAAVDPLRLRQAPMLAAAASFAAGIILARHWQPPALLLAMLLLLVSLSLFALQRVQRVAVLPVLALWVVAGCFCAQIEPVIPQQNALQNYADGLSRQVTGRVLRVEHITAPHDTNDDPRNALEPWQIEPGGWEPMRGNAVETVDIAVDHVEEVTPDISTMQPVAGGARVTLMGTPPPLHCGDAIDVPLRLREPEIYRDPGVISSADLLAQRGIGVLATAKSTTLRVTAAPRMSWRCIPVRAQQAAATRLNAFVTAPANLALHGWLHLDDTDAAMLGAMLFGDRTRLSESLTQPFARTGTFHLIVVSGLQITLLAAALMLLLRKLRVADGYAVAITLPLITAYALLTGFALPVERALLMTAAFLLALCVARRASSLNALGIAAVVVLAIDPRTLFGVSFQMTFLVLLAIVGVAMPLRERTFAPRSRALQKLERVELDVALLPRLAAFRVHLRLIQEIFSALTNRRLHRVPVWAVRIFFWMCDVLLFGLTIELCMVLPMAVYFHRATLLALPANVFSFPLLVVMLLASSVFFLALLVNAWVAMPFAAVAAVVLHAVRWIVNIFGRTRFDIRVPSPAELAIAISCLAIAFACWALRERSRWLALAGALAMLLAPCVMLWPEPPLFHRGLLEVTAIDVGQGDSLLVISPEGKTLLVDAGGPVGNMRSVSGWDIGEEVVAPYLWSRRIRHLDAMLLTHAHSDHMGGMPAVMRDFHPRELWLGVEPRDSPEMRALLVQARTQGVKVRWFRAGDKFHWSDLNASVLSPEPGYSNPGAPVNDDSLVVRLQDGKASVLLEGDAERPSEEAMLAHGYVTPVTLLKVGHHGSNTSSIAPFLAAAQPRDAVISVGRHNTFGHPRIEVLQRLEDDNIKVFRTDREGAETFLLSPQGGISATQDMSTP